MNKKLYLFSQLPVDRQFYFGGNSSRLFIKITPLHAALVVDFDDPTKTENWKIVNPHVLIFPDVE